MQQLVIIIHMLVALGLIALILVQHGKGADMGAAFGSGASNTMFGSQGSLPFLVKVTVLLAVIFFASSLGLGYLDTGGSKVHQISQLSKQTSKHASTKVAETPHVTVPVDSDE